jgi:hypothetical protein
MATKVMRAVRWLGVVGVLAATAGGPTACASPRDEIVRVQPGALHKSTFVRKDDRGAWLDDSDAWYFRATVIDSPAANSVPTADPRQGLFIGAGSDMSRVKWRIEETFLLAIKENPDIEGAGDTKGGVVAAFPILRHFDVRRSYNLSTGEETNVVEENDTDRPWWAREYVRVDWSRNVLSEAGFAFPAFESISPATYFVQDPTDENAPIFQNDYVDVTARYSVRPTIETCYYLHRSTNCGPAEMTARLSFMKVPERDYVPREYPDRLPYTDVEGAIIRAPNGAPYSAPVMDQFGIFRVERAIYDRRYGTLERRFVYRARIWNLWEKWFERDESGKVVEQDGKEKLLPYSQRKVRPIVFFLNPDWPVEMRPMAREVAAGWNDVFQETVAALRLFETKGEVLAMADVRAEVDAMKARAEDVYVVCENNPVQEGDHPACGPVGTRARVGDQRFSFMYWVNKPQPSGPLGYGPSYSDPITGELFNAGAYVYGAALDVAAQRALEIVNLLNGKFTANDYIEGVATDQYAKRLLKGEVPGPSASFVTPGTKGFDLGQLQAQVDRSIDRPLLASIKQNGLPQAAPGEGRKRLDWIKGTPLERAILDNPETRALLGKTDGQGLSEDELRDVSKLLLGSEDLVAEDQKRQTFLGEHGCFYPVDFADDVVVGLARELLAKYGKGATPAEDEAIQKKMWQEIRHYYSRQVMEHEVGHTLGLAHNFEGSADPINFFDEYWKLKGDDAKFGDPVTEEQKSKKMVEYQYSTVMDYTSRFNSEIHGLGKYDYAAVRFAYGDVVEAWPAGKVVDPLYTEDLTRFQYNLGLGGYSAEALDRVIREYRHYTQVPRMFADKSASLMKNGRELRRFGDVFAAAQEAYRGTAPGRRGQLKTGSWTVLPATARQTSIPNPIDVVPYRWCGDQFAGSVGRPLCERWDTGVDAFEIVKDAIDRYRSYYVFDAFVRGRVDGYTRLRSYLGTISSRYFSHVHRQYIHWLFNGVYGINRPLWEQILDRGGVGVSRGYIGDTDWYKDPGGGLPQTIAVTWGLDRLVDVLGTPDVGRYEIDPKTGYLAQTASSVFACSDGGNPVRCENDASSLTVGLEDGARFRYTTFESGSGYYGWQRPKVVGSFYDKMAALLSITDSNANFIGQDTTNAVSYRIGYYLAYPRALTSLVGGIVNDDVSKFGWRYDFDPATKTGKIGSVDLFTKLGADDAAKPDLSTVTGTPVDSGWFLYYKAYALLFSMAEFQANYSQSWNDAVRVYCVGCGEAFTPGAGIATTSFVNPLSGKEYAAIRYGDGRYSPGAQLVDRGAVLAKAYRDAIALPESDGKATTVVAATNALNEHVKLLDLVRGLYEVYGYSRF